MLFFSSKLGNYKFSLEFNMDNRYYDIILTLYEMNKISICWTKDCNNTENNFHNCEDYVALRLSKINLDYLKDVYDRLLADTSLDHIESTTEINWMSATEFFFQRLINEFFWCENLAITISEIRRLNWDIHTNPSVSELLKIKKAQIWYVLYWFKDNFMAFVSLAREYSEKYRTDIFINFLVKLDAIYKISENAEYIRRNGV